MKIYKEQEMLEKLERHINSNYVHACEYAKEKGVSSQFLSAVRKGKKNPTKEMLKDLGLIAHKINHIIYSES